MAVHYFFSNKMGLSLPILFPQINTTNMENSSYSISKGSRREIMEQELVRGRDTANKLLEVLVHTSKSNNNNNSNEEELMLLLPYAEHLVNEVLKSFTNTLLLLNTTTINSSRDFSSSSSLMSTYQKHHDDEDLDEACKNFEEESRTGRCKRKSTVPNWEKDSPILIEDGHAWRKYGQKKTMNSKYLRNYYRCTYKYEQGCPAMKHVQRIQDDPPLYRTTYYGHHNCKSTFNREIILEADYDYSFSGSSKFLSFNSNNAIISSKQHYYHQFSSSPPVFESSTKQEPMEEVMMAFHDVEPIIIAHHQNQFDYDEELDYLWTQFE